MAKTTAETRPTTQISTSDVVEALVSVPTVVPKHWNEEMLGRPKEVMKVPLADTQLTKARPKITLVKVFISDDGN